MPGGFDATGWSNGGTGIRKALELQKKGIDRNSSLPIAEVELTPVFGRNNLSPQSAWTFKGEVDDAIICDLCQFVGEKGVKYL